MQHGNINFLLRERRLSVWLSTGANVKRGAVFLDNHHRLRVDRQLLDILAFANLVMHERLPLADPPIGVPAHVSSLPSVHVLVNPICEHIKCPCLTRIPVSCGC